MSTISKPQVHFQRSFWFLCSDGWPSGTFSHVQEASHDHWDAQGFPQISSDFRLCWKIVGSSVGLRVYFTSTFIFKTIKVTLFPLIISFTNINLSETTAKIPQVRVLLYQPPKQIKAYKITSWYFLYSWFPQLSAAITHQVIMCSSCDVCIL